MEITRRGFLTLTGAIGSGITLSSLGINLIPTKAYAEELNKMNRIKNAKQVITTCCYCSVGCGLICSVDKTTGKIFNIEGDSEHPINEGSLCAKGAGFFDLTEANKYRLKKVLYRAPMSDKWEEKDWNWAIERIARLVKDTRDKEFVTKNAKGELVNRAKPSVTLAAPTSIMRNAGSLPPRLAPSALSISIIRPGSDTAPL